MTLTCITGCSKAEEETAEPENKKMAEVTIKVSADSTKEDFEKEIWDYLVMQYENEYAAAAMMGNSDFETALCSYRTEGDKEIDENGRYTFSYEYTQKVDSGEVDREEFAYAGPNGGAYGLFAWTSAGRKEGLYDFAQSRGISIANWQMQLDYAYTEIVERYYELYCELLTADNVYDATESFGMIFEQPVGIAYTVSRRAQIAQDYYDKYSSGSFEPKYRENTLMPVNHSYDYMNEVFDRDVINSNIYVYMAQTVLKEKGYLNEKPCGYYGNEVERAIKELQENNDVAVDGILGPEVWSLLS